MKKNISIIAILAVAASIMLSACNNAEEESTTTTTTTAESTTTTASETTTNTNTSVTAKGVLESIRTAYGDAYLSNAEIPAELLESQFSLKADMYDEVAAEMPMIGTHPDRVVIVKAKSGQADAVEKALNDAKQSMLEEGMQYPMNVAKVNATQVVKNGDYVALICAGAIDERENASEEDAKKFAEEEIKKGVDAFEKNFK